MTLQSLPHNANLSLGNFGKDQLGAICRFLHSGPCAV
jgi:hypothetical protein